MDESFGRRKFCISMENIIKGYERKMLCRSECPNILPMYFQSEDGEEKAYYDFTGFLPLEDYVKKNLASAENVRKDHGQVRFALDILSRVLSNLMDMENYLLCAGRAAIGLDVIFIDPANGEVRFAYYPEGKSEVNLQTRILRLIDTMCELFNSAEAVAYFWNFKEQIILNNLGLSGMIRSLSNMQREVSYVYWNPDELRKDRENSASPSHERGETDRLERSWHRPAAIQVLLGLALVGVFVAGALDHVQFAGLVMLAAGGDFMLIRKLSMQKKWK